MEKAGDVLDGMVFTDGDRKRVVVQAHRDRVVEGLRQLNDNVPHYVVDRDGAEYRVESPLGKRLTSRHVRSVNVVRVLLPEREGKRGGTDPRKCDHEDGRTAHTMIQ